MYDSDDGLDWLRRLGWRQHGDELVACDDNHKLRSIFNNNINSPVIQRILNNTNHDRNRAWDMYRYIIEIIALLLWHNPTKSLSDYLWIYQSIKEYDTASDTNFSQYFTENNTAEQDLGKLTLDILDATFASFEKTDYKREKLISYGYMRLVTKAVKHKKTAEYLAKLIISSPYKHIDFEIDIDNDEYLEIDDFEPFEKLLDDYAQGRYKLHQNDNYSDLNIIYQQHENIANLVFTLTNIYGWLFVCYRHKKHAKKTFKLPIIVKNIFLQLSKGKKLGLSYLNLYEANLTGADLEGANLSYANLNDADLSNADLKKANLSHANLNGADLSNADLKEANLSHADLSYSHIWQWLDDVYLKEAGLSAVKANLSGTNLSGLNLSHANLSGLNLSHANLKNANLGEARLVEADLSNANLNRANLKGAKFFKTYLSGADLSKSDLSGSDFRGENLEGANLSEANLVGAILNGAILNGADLRGANLNIADLSGANLKHANLSKVDLSSVNLSGANLYEADLSGANLKHANLSKVDLSHANLNGADLSNADLKKANLNGANLNGADLSGVNLREADLSLANLSGANLSLANLSGAKLSYANLNYANLSGADLSGSYLNGADLSGARYSQGTKFPKNFVPTDERMLCLQKVELDDDIPF